MANLTGRCGVGTLTQNVPGAFLELQNTTVTVNTVVKVWTKQLNVVDFASTFCAVDVVPGQGLRILASQPYDQSVVYWELVEVA